MANLLAFTGCSYRSARRFDSDPAGHLTIEEIPEFVKVCTYSGDRRSANWLKSLIALAQNGQLRRVRDGAETFDDHREYVHALKANGSIKFGLNDHVQCKETGKFGTIVDYIPDTKEYIVILDPFQVKMYKDSDLNKAG